MTRSFTIEAGKRYMRRDGSITDPLVPAHDLKTCFVDPESNFYYSNRPDGHLALGCYTESPEDLIGIYLLG